jgi:hypothetical protein
MGQTSFGVVVAHCEHEIELRRARSRELFHDFEWRWETS